ncbi:MAG: hypothetical protein EBR99_04490 [Actinobacteria bacterium]|nr:hypothetical protein [Actinomycetota bacterium]
MIQRVLGGAIALAVRQARRQIKREMAWLWWSVAGIAWFIRHGERRRAKAEFKVQRKAAK